jgi:hypothetical protein
MARYREATAWVLSSLGIALLVAAVILGPTGLASAQTGNQCADAGCKTACTQNAPGCDSHISGCQCSPNDASCDCEPVAPPSTACICEP